GRIAQRETGNPEHGGFFLKATRIGQNQMGPTHESDEIEVAEGVDVDNPLVSEEIPRIPLGLAAVALPDELLFDSRVDREDDRDVAGQRLERFEKNSHT